MALCRGQRFVMSMWSYRLGKAGACTCSASVSYPGTQYTACFYWCVCSSVCTALLGVRRSKQSVRPVCRMFIGCTPTHCKTVGVCCMHWQWRIQDLSEGSGAVTGLKCEHDKWCDREAITRERSPRFSRGVRGMLPRKILKIEMLRYAFSALLGVFLSLNKGSKLLSWLVTELKSPTVRYGWSWTFLRLWKPTY